MLIFNMWLWNEEDPSRRNILKCPREKVFNDQECEKDFVNSLFHTPIIPYKSKVSSLESCLVFLKHLHICCLVSCHINL